MLPVTDPPPSAIISVQSWSAEAVLLGLPLPPAHIHVWRVDMDDPAHNSDQYFTNLSAEERERSARYVTAVLGRRYVVRKAILRFLLAGYLNLTPTEIRFAYNERGKPMLDAQRHPDPVHFNVTDAGSQALLAFTRIGAIGIDLEAVIAIPDMMQVARYCFSAQEQAQLDQLSGEAPVRGFYHAWTRKEALIKAEGTGLSRAVDRFSVTLTPGEPARLLHADAPSLYAYELFDLTVDATHVAAVAVRRA